MHPQQRQLHLVAGLWSALALLQDWSPLRTWAPAVESRTPKEYAPAFQRRISIPSLLILLLLVVRNFQTCISLGLFYFLQRAVLLKEYSGLLARRPSKLAPQSALFSAREDLRRVGERFGGGVALIIRRWTPCGPLADSFYSRPLAFRQSRVQDHFGSLLVVWSPIPRAKKRWCNANNDGHFAF